ncbi:MAG TPA: hypothetical protein VF615_27745 [Longimicrobiaceae bacterium]
MEPFSAELAQRLAVLEAKLEARETRRARFLDVADRVLVPLAVALLAFATGWASYRTSAGQFALARAIEARQAREAVEARQLKYVELFYRDIADPAPARQMAAASLLSVLQPEYSRPLLRVIESNPALSAEVRRQALGQVAVSNRFGPLINYRIAIFYPTTEPNLRNAARIIQAKLAQERFPGEVTLRPSTDQVLGSMRLPDGNEIRFDRHYEEEAARELQRVLNSYGPHFAFKLVPIDRGRTDNYISLFVGKPR